MHITYLLYSYITDLLRLQMVGRYAIEFKHILFNKYIEWGWVTSSANISYDPPPTMHNSQIT